MSRLDRASRRHPRRLVRATPRLTAQVESFYAIRHELPPLFEQHWRELALDHDAIPLAPDWDRYLGMTATGNLHITTARFGDKLVGYIFNFVGPHMHYATTLHAEMEMFWLDPAYRGGWFAIRLFRTNERHLRKLGVKKIMAATKTHYLAGRVGSILLKRLGFKPFETNWSKVI